MGDRITAQGIAKVYDVPPWLIDGSIPRPRFARLRWQLRRVFPSLVWGAR